MFGHAALFMIATGIPALAHATILPFTITGGPASGDFMPQAYGDRVSSITQTAGLATYTYQQGNGWTPNVEVGYGFSFTGSPTASDLALNGARYWNDNEWQGVFFTRGVGTSTVFYDVTFTPDSGFGVLVNSFQIDDYANFRSGHTVRWTVFRDFIGSPNILATGTSVVGADTTVGNSDNLTVLTGLSAAHFGTVILRFEHVAGSGNDLAIDNINFDQVVPTPSAAVVAGLGLIAAGRRRR
jgi:hypothetical protein